MAEIFSQEEIAAQVERESGTFTQNWSKGCSEKKQFDGWVSALIESAMAAYNTHQGDALSGAIGYIKQRFVAEASDMIGTWAARNMANTQLSSIASLARKKTGQREVS
ncbi:MAG: hypothetical protein AB7F82_06760 [Alphaproteobacteria bacterium]